jgi:hypothetical protein
MAKNILGSPFHMNILSINRLYSSFFLTNDSSLWLLSREYRYIREVRFLFVC